MQLIITNADLLRLAVLSGAVILVLTLSEVLRFAAGAGLGLCIALAAYGLQMLTLSGAAATFLLASIVFGIGGWQWTLPIFAFFLLSSLLSRWRGARKQRFDSMFEKGGTRDAGQVAANGAIVGALAIVWYVSGNDNLYLLSLVAVAVVTADTWGTELGVLARKRPRSIVTRKTVPAGTSGGVTFAGTLSGALGAAIVTTAAFPFFDLNSGSYLLIVLLGVAGSAIDSVLGATLQAQYRCAVCHADTEKSQHCDSSTQHVRGYRWMTNDAVNMLSTLLAVLLGTVLLLLF